MKRSLALTAVFALIGAGGLASLPAGCITDTGSKRFTFQASAGGIEHVGSGVHSFTNQAGWTVTLTRADMTIGPIYLNVAPPLRGVTQRLLDVVVTSAWADGESHLGVGRVVGEVLGQVKFSAISSELMAMPVAGSIAQEEVRTAEIWFYPAAVPGTGADTSSIGTVALDVAGEATRGATRVRFRGALKLDDAWVPTAAPGARGTLTVAELRKVRGIPAPFFPEEGGRLEIRVDVARLFRGADFANLEGNPSDPDGTKVLVQAKSGKVTTDQVMTNLYQGLREAEQTYFVRWVRP